MAFTKKAVLTLLQDNFSLTAIYSVLLSEIERFYCSPSFCYLFYLASNSNSEMHHHLEPLKDGRLLQELIM